MKLGDLIARLRRIHDAYEEDGNTLEVYSDREGIITVNIDSQMYIDIKLNED